MRAAPVFFLAFALSGCGDVDIVGIGGAGGASSSDATKSSSATGVTTGATTTITSAATGTSVGTTGGGPAEISAALVDGQFYMDCMPGGGGDPIGGSFDVAYDNTGGATGTLDVSSATLTMLGPNGGSVTWAFAVAPVGSGAVVPGETAKVTHAKVPESGMGTPNVANPCSMCGGKWTLHVGWDDGVTGTAAALDLGAISCAF